MDRPAGIVLAGGLSRRLGRDKLTLRRGDRTLLDVVVSAAGQTCGPVVVVGPHRPLAPGVVDVGWAQEQPPGGGPVAGLAAGLDHLGQAAPLLVAVLAGDAPRGPQAVPSLVAALQPDDDAAILRSGDGRDQPLCGVYRTTALRIALDGLGDSAGASLRQLLAALTVRRVDDHGDHADDIDTVDDATRLGFTPG